MAEAARRWDRQIKQTQAGVNAELQRYISAASARDIFPDGLGALDTPVAILASDERILKDRHIERLKSSAKMVVDRRGTSGDRVSFLYLFKNNFSTPFLYDFLGVYSASGHAGASAEGGTSLTFGNLQSGRVTVEVNIELVPASGTAESLTLAQLVAAGAEFIVPFATSSDSEQRTFARGGFVNATSVALQGSETAIVLVSLAVNTEIDGKAHVVVDMDKGNFGIRCPAVLVVPKRAVLTLPDGLVISTL